MSSTGTEPRHEPGSRARLRTLAIAVCVPTIFYGVLGTGSTLIVWALIEFDPTRPDFYACLFAAAGPISFLLHLGRGRKRGRPRPRFVPAALNVACIAAACVTALSRPQALADPFLCTVLALLVAGPLLNLSVLRST